MTTIIKYPRQAGDNRPCFTYIATLSTGLQHLVRAVSDEQALQIVARAPELKLTAGLMCMDGYRNLMCDGRAI